MARSSSRAGAPITLAALLACAFQSGCSSTGGAPTADYARLVNGLRSVGAWGFPGPLRGLNDGIVPIVVGDEDTDPPNVVVAVAANVGAGRVVALGHDGFFDGEALPLYDNARFARNVVAWLDISGRRRVVATTGHDEWVDWARLDPLRRVLEARGYTFAQVPGVITPAALADADVVFIGNAWAPVADVEIDALTQFVQRGGGLLLEGLGWSWRYYAGPLSCYPMSRVGERFGVLWMDGVVTDPTDHDGEYPLFHVFCPTLQSK
jgi:hypothetical protein